MTRTPLLTAALVALSSALAAQADEGLWTRLLRDGPSALWSDDGYDSLRHEALELAHRAAEQAAADDLEAAIATLKRARVSWPDSPYLAHTIADHYDDLGEHDQALRWYDIAAPLGEPFRAHYHAGQIAYDRAVAALDEAGVPADVDLLPDPAPPELMEAVRAGITQLTDARDRFLDALLERRDARASESVAAITKRLDELREMLDELERQQEEQQQDEGEDGDEGEEGEEGDDADEPPDDSGEGDPSDEPGDEQQDGDDDAPPEEPDGEQEGDDAPQDDEQADPSEAPPPPAPPVEQFLSPEQIKLLEDRLEEMAERAARLEAARRRRERQAGERDW